ncbi:MAG: hypothetical protein QOH83_2565 [Solirubrobacteraceae bacterium]|nr:hypothetical protein [Solirubrobacteraceae bacterium]
MLSRSFACGAACVLALTLLCGAVPASAKHGGGGGGGGDGEDGRREARVAGACSAGATSKLRLRSRDGAISVEFEVQRRRGGERWRVVLVHERRVAWRSTIHTKGSSGSFRIRRSLDDYDGPDEVTARASGPRGLTCEASATLAA